jgi:hypothetical protein
VGDLQHTFHGDAAVAIKFDLEAPLLSRRQRRDRLALHRLNEGRFYGLKNRHDDRAVYVATRLIARGSPSFR